MKLSRQSGVAGLRGSCRRQGGLLLVECLVYIGLSALVVGMAFAAFYHVWENAQSIRRVSADIARTLQAGERWREDVRRATGPLILSGGAGAGPKTLTIPQANAEVTYVFTSTNVTRSGGSTASQVQTVSGVKAFRLVEERRRQVSIWRWEIELRSSPKAKLRPLFTFLAVESQGGGR